MFFPLFVTCILEVMQLRKKNVAYVFLEYTQKGGDEIIRMGFEVKCSERILLDVTQECFFRKRVQG